MILDVGQDGVNILNSSGITLLQSVIESGDDNVVVKEVPTREHAAF